MQSRPIMFSQVGAICITFSSLIIGCAYRATDLPKEQPIPQAAAVESDRQDLLPTRDINHSKAYSIGGKSYAPPVKVKDATMTMDGGTLTLWIVDSQGKELVTCNDGRGCLDCKDSPEQRPIYIGGYHPISKSAKPLPLGGTDEQELYRLLKDWYDDAQRQGGPKFEGDSLIAGLQAKAATDFLRFLERHVERHKPKPAG